MQTKGQSILREHFAVRWDGQILRYADSLRMIFDTLLDEVDPFAVCYIV